MSAPTFRPVSMIFTPDELSEVTPIYLMPPLKDPALYYRHGGAGPLLKEVGELVELDKQVRVLPRLDIDERDRALLLGAALSSLTVDSDITTGWSTEKRVKLSSYRGVATVIVRAEGDDHEAALTPWPWSEDPTEHAVNAAIRSTMPVDPKTTGARR